FLEMNGLSDEEAVTGGTYRERFPVAAEMAGPPPATGRSFEARLPDNHWFAINERRTKDGGHVSVATNISAIKQHEEKLVNSERTLLATVADLRRSRKQLE